MRAAHCWAADQWIPCHSCAGWLGLHSCVATLCIQLTGQPPAIVWHLPPWQVVVVSVRGDKVSLSQRSADEIAAVRVQPALTVEQ